MIRHLGLWEEKEKERGGYKQTTRGQYSHRLPICLTSCASKKSLPATNRDARKVVEYETPRRMGPLFWAAVSGERGATSPMVTLRSYMALL